MISSTVQFNLVINNELKEELIDILMAFEPITGFSLWPICGYSKRHSHFDISEQVRGYRSLTRFEILLDSNHVDALKMEIEQVNSSEDIRYWQTPTC
jgi:hypothetical protein